MKTIKFKDASTVTCCGCESEIFDRSFVIYSFLDSKHKTYCELCISDLIISEILECRMCGTEDLHLSRQNFRWVEGVGLVTFCDTCTVDSVARLENEILDVEESRLVRLFSDRLNYNE